MSKLNLQKGDRINARTPSTIDENPPYKKIGGNENYEKPLTVTKAYSHGVSTKEAGYVHNNNILNKAE